MANNDEKLVPSLDLCKQIEMEEDFRDSEMVWAVNDAAAQYTLIRRWIYDHDKKYTQCCPAPKLAEIVDKLPMEFNEHPLRMNVNSLFYMGENGQPFGDLVENSYPQGWPSAAIKLWIKVKHPVEAAS